MESPCASPAYDLHALVTDPRDLYGLPLDRFVAERAALAKALRSEGDRERSAHVAKLRKPSVAAWAVNQLVRTQRGAIAELFKSGDQLQRAQSELLAGRGADALRTAAERERIAADRLTAMARELLTSQGHELSSSVIERVRETLHAAAVDQNARSEVADGCLERELRHVGVGGSGTTGVAPRGPSTKPSSTSRASARKQDRGRRPSTERAQREQSERLKGLRKAAQDARRAAARATRELRAAQERRDRAVDALQSADAALADARHRADEATLAQEHAEQAQTKASD